MERLQLKYPRGVRTFEVSSFLAQMDDLHERLRKDCVGLKPAELRWQPRAGVNTIGMLLAHIAIVEVFWYGRAADRDGFAEIERTLGITMDDDGLPLAPGGRPPRALGQRPLAWFLRLLERARAYRGRVARGLRESDLDGHTVYRRPNGRWRRTERRWILYHTLEHTAGHYYQINTLRRMVALAKGRVPRET